MADEVLYIPNGTTIEPYPFDGALGSLTYSELLTAIAAAPSTGKLYLKDTATPAHYWKLTVSTLGVISTTDVGTTAPTDGMVGTE